MQDNVLAYKENYIPHTLVPHIRQNSPVHDLNKRMNRKQGYDDGYHAIHEVVHNIFGANGFDPFNGKFDIEYFVLAYQVLLLKFMGRHEFTPELLKVFENLSTVNNLPLDIFDHPPLHDREECLNILLDMHQHYGLGTPEKIGQLCKQGTAREIKGVFRAFRKEAFYRAYEEVVQCFYSDRNFENHTINLQRMLNYHVGNVTGENADSLRHRFSDLTLRARNVIEYYEQLNEEQGIYIAFYDADGNELQHYITGQINWNNLFSVPAYLDESEYEREICTIRVAYNNGQDNPDQGEILFEGHKSNEDKWEFSPVPEGPNNIGEYCALLHPPSEDHIREVFDRLYPSLMKARHSLRTILECTACELNAIPASRTIKDHYGWKKEEKVTQWAELLDKASKVVENMHFHDFLADDIIDHALSPDYKLAMLMGGVRNAKDSVISSLSGIASRINDMRYSI